MVADESAFAAALHGGFDAEVGGDVAEFEGVGVNYKEGHGFGDPFGQDDALRERGAQGVEEELAVHGLRRWFDFHNPAGREDDTIFDF